MLITRNNAAWSCPRLHNRTTFATIIARRALQGHRAGEEKQKKKTPPPAGGGPGWRNRETGPAEFFAARENRALALARLYLLAKLTTSRAHLPAFCNQICIPPPSPTPSACLPSPNRYPLCSSRHFNTLQRYGRIEIRPFLFDIPHVYPCFRFAQRTCRVNTSNCTGKHGMTVRFRPAIILPDRPSNSRAWRRSSDFTGDGAVTYLSDH